MNTFVQGETILSAQKKVTKADISRSIKARFIKLGILIGNNQEKMHVIFLRGWTKNCGCYGNKVGKLDETWILL